MESGFISGTSTVNYPPIFNIRSFIAWLHFLLDLNLGRGFYPEVGGIWLFLKQCLVVWHSLSSRPSRVKNNFGEQLD